MSNFMKTEKVNYNWRLFDENGSCVELLCLQIDMQVAIAMITKFNILKTKQNVRTETQEGWILAKGNEEEGIEVHHVLDATIWNVGY